MSFWDREVRDSIDRMFDRNRDGYIDRSEEVMEFMFLEDMEKETSDDNEEDDDFDEDDDFADDDWDEDGEEDYEED